MPPHPRPRHHAFTLVELLVVIAMITLLIAIAAPSLRLATSGAPATSAAAGLAHLFDLARAESQARQSPVWVALANGTSPSGQPQIHAALFAASDGLPSAPPSGLELITAPSAWDMARLVDPQSVHPDIVAQLARLSPVSPTFPQPSNPNIRALPTSLSSPGSSFPFDSYATLTFSPLGELLLASSPSAFDPALALAAWGIVEDRGGAPSPGPRDAIIAVDGPTGRPHVLSLR
jgi:prepilin-type N-terminal cleavage/methylation domain-containing protein